MDTSRARNIWCLIQQTILHTQFNLLFQIDGVTIGSLDDVPSGPVTTFFKSVRNTLDFDFEDENEGRSYGMLSLFCWQGQTLTPNNSFLSGWKCFESCVPLLFLHPLHIRGKCQFKTLQKIFFVWFDLDFDLNGAFREFWQSLYQILQLKISSCFQMQVAGSQMYPQHYIYSWIAALVNFQS